MADGGGSDDLAVAFVFVPRGAPDPVDWKAQHPGWVSLPATFTAHRSAAANSADAPASGQAGTASARYPAGWPAAAGAPIRRGRAALNDAGPTDPPGS